MAKRKRDLTPEALFSRLNRQERQYVDWFANSRGWTRKQALEYLERSKKILSRSS